MSTIGLQRSVSDDQFPRDGISQIASNSWRPKCRSAGRTDYPGLPVSMVGRRQDGKISPANKIKSPGYGMESFRCICYRDSI